MKVVSDRFASIPQFVIEQASGNAVKLYGVLYGLGSFDRPERSASRRVLAEAMQTSVDTIDRTLAELEQIGAVEKHRTKLPSGSWGASTYHLAAVRGSRKGAATLAAPARPASRKAADSSLLPSDIEPQSRALATFEAFWNIYPRQVDKPRARAAFLAVLKRPGVGYDDIMDGVYRFASDPNLPPEDEARFIPHPSTWLRGERWNDGPLPSRGRRNGRAGQVTEAEIMAAMS